MLSVQSFVNHPVTSNCFLLYDKENGKDCIIVDPGSKDENDLENFIEREELIPKYIILTHEHFDHCWGVNSLVEKFQIPMVCSQLCAEAIKNEKKNCSVFYDNNDSFTINSETISVESMDNTMLFLGHEILFFKTPGHTDASISFVVDQFLFTGDTLIKDEKTVTKLPTGSVERLKSSIEIFNMLKGRRLTVCPGHGVGFAIDGYDMKKA